MKANLETLEKVIEAMPIFGELREQNRELKFGQYLTVLKEWFDSLRLEKANLEKELRETPTKDLVGIPIPMDDFEGEAYLSGFLHGVEAMIEKILGEEEVG